MRRILRPLDRYVLVEFWKVLAATALGFPLLVIVIDISEKMDNYFARELTVRDIALAYLYGIPDTMFLVLPAAVLFATVFTVGGFTRHSEITAAKASGISFHRFILPIALGAVAATFLGLGLAEIIPPLNSRRLELLKEKQVRAANQRSNFAYAADEGRVYKIGYADVVTQTLSRVEVERRGVGPDYPTYLVTAREGAWRAAAGWQLSDGWVHILPDSLSNVSIQFDSLRDRHFTEQPVHLMANPKAPAEMGYRDLGRFIAAMERSGADVRKLRVERMLKIAIPVTCVIIMLIGAPLATSTQRGGTAYGVAVSLATTVVFLVLLQLTQAIGASGLVMPELAAWLPGMLFAGLGTFLLVKVRT
ncbi:MAG: LptF/LptG family permease [Gemmatimonadaceae bacterium]